jgi:acetaldehyde dehydrogenase (acetylating)
LKKPAFRIVVNTPTTHGSIGLTTGLDPAMTLGCGGYGGNITSDNIGPRHLLNIKRLAYEIAPAKVTSRGTAAPAAERAGPSPLPKAPSRPVPAPIAAAPLARRIDEFLASRGLGGQSSLGGSAEAAPSPASGGVPSQPSIGPVPSPMQFVCEEDVRQAMSTGRKIVLAERAIVTPAARDLGESQNIFEAVGWR